MGVDEPPRDRAPNPYAPPAASPAARPPPAGAAGGTTWATDVDRRIPAVCLKCGATDGIRRREQRFTVSPAARGIGMSGGVVGAVVANATRHDRELTVPLLVGIFAVLGVVVWVVNKAARHVHLSLPLCTACDARWNAGVAIRRWLLGALAVACVVLLYGVATSATPVVVAGGVLLAVMIGAAFAAKLPARFVGVQRIEGNMATLTGVAPAAVPLLEQGGPPKKARKKKAAPEA